MNWIINGISQKDFALAGGSVSGRAQLMELSWNTWLSSWRAFLLGVGDHRTGHIIGNHSDLIDTLARFGIVGGIIFSKLSIAQFTFLRLLDDKQSSYKTQCMIVFLLYIVRGFFGNILTPAIAVQVFLFLPLLFERCYLLNESDHKEGSVKESRGQPKAGTLKQAIKKIAF